MHRWACDMAELAIGIDLGTTFSVAAHLDNQGRPWTVSNAEGDLTTPSVVFFDKTATIVGKEASKAAEFEPDRVARFVKRSMGDQRFALLANTRSLRPEVVQALILRKIKQDAERKLGPVGHVVITVPAYFNEPRRKATQDAGHLAGLDVLDIINEPTAAALAFGVQRGFLGPEGASQEKETVLVYDLGGGTFDVTLMEIEGRSYRAVATSGDVYLGGIEWDQRIVNFVADHFQTEFGIDPRDEPRVLQTLLAEAADAKHALSVREETTVHIAHEGHRLRLPISRVQFESLTGELLDRTLIRINRLFRESKRSWADVTRLLLVGGSTRMPMVQRMLEAESGLPTDHSLAPDEAVAHGAAIYAGLLSKSDFASCSGMSVANVNSHDLGVLGIERETGRKRRKILVPRNTTLPAERTATFATHKQEQANVRVTIVEGGDATGQHATVIGKCVVTDLPTGLPARSPVDVSFLYTPDGRLRVAAAVPGTDCQATTTIHRASGMSEAELAAWRERIEAGIVLDELPADEPPAGEPPDDTTPPPAGSPSPGSGSSPGGDSTAEGSPENAGSDAPLDLGDLPDLTGSVRIVDLDELGKLHATGRHRADTPNEPDDGALGDFLKGLGQS